MLCRRGGKASPILQTTSWQGEAKGSFQVKIVVLQRWVVFTLRTLLSSMLFTWGVKDQTTSRVPVLARHISGGVQLPTAPFSGRGETTLLHWEQSCERGRQEHWRWSCYLHSGAAIGPVAQTSLKRDFESGREILYWYNMRWDVQMSQKCLLLWPSQWSVLPHCLFVLLLSTCLYPRLITSWKLQELWDMAIVPALQGLGLGMALAFPSTYGNLGIVRINTEIILGKLKKPTNQNPQNHKNKRVC